MVGFELFNNFYCNYKRITFNDCFQLIFVNFRWPVTKLLILKPLIFFVSVIKLLYSNLHYFLYFPLKSHIIHICSFTLAVSLISTIFLTSLFSLSIYILQSTLSILPLMLRVSWSLLPKVTYSLPELQQLCRGSIGLLPFIIFTYGFSW